MTGPRRFVLGIALLLSLSPLAAAAGRDAKAALVQPWDQALYAYLEGEFGAEGKLRFQRLEAILLREGGASTMKRLQAVNAFFNELPWVADAEKYRQSDYWATLFETVGTFGGDCEDMVLAKYSALLTLGVPARELALTYVQHRSLGPHMVLSYVTRRGVQPLVMDNMTADILPLNRRTDLVPVYAFNQAHVWQLASQRSARRTRRMPASRLRKWTHWQTQHAHMRAVARRHNAGRDVFPPIGKGHRH